MLWTHPSTQCENSLPTHNLSLLKGMGGGGIIMVKAYILKKLRFKNLTCVLLLIYKQKNLTCVLPLIYMNQMSLETTKPVFSFRPDLIQAGQYSKKRWEEG